MRLDIAPCGDDYATFRAIVEHPSLASDFDLLVGSSLDTMLADPFGPPDLRWIGLVDGVPAGFAFTFLLPGRDQQWAMIWLGVIDRFRRSGLGSRLIQTAVSAIRSQAPRTHEICTSAWLPNPAAEAFASRHGFEPNRFTWLMERAGSRVPDPDWPPGIETRVFAPSDRAFEDWNQVYNQSFADHDHSVVSTVDECRRLMARPEMDPSSLLLAYRDGRCVGHCRNEIHDGRGEVAILGVIPEARRTGLGRALLRWGVRWLLEARTSRVTLLVHGANDRAIALYRSEGFEVARTRRTWSRFTAP